MLALLCAFSRASLFENCLTVSSSRRLSSRYGIRCIFSRYKRASSFLPVCDANHRQNSFKQKSIQTVLLTPETVTSSPLKAGITPPLLATIRAMSAKVFSVIPVMITLSDRSFLAKRTMSAVVEDQLNRITRSFSGTKRVSGFSISPGLTVNTSISGIMVWIKSFPISHM